MNPLPLKNICSPAEKTNVAPQSVHISSRSTIVIAVVPKAAGKGENCCLLNPMSLGHLDALVNFSIIAIRLDAKHGQHRSEFKRH